MGDIILSGSSSSGGGGGGAVTIADGADVAEGATTDAAVITDTTGTISGKLRGLVKWAFERMPAALGQTTMANSLSVVIASNQSELTVKQGTAAGVTAGWPVTNGQATVGTLSLTNASANLTALTSSMTGYSSVAVQIHAPSTISNGLLVFQVTVDGTNWTTVGLREMSNVASGNAVFPTVGSVIFNSTAFDKTFVGNIAGATQFRVIYDTFGGIFTIAGAGTITIASAPSAVASTGGTFATVVGQNANNTSITSSQFLGVTPAIANAAAPSYTEARTVVLSSDLNGVLRTGGAALSGATKVGSPVLNGGVFNTTQPTVTNGQVVDLQATARGALIVATGVDAFSVVGTKTPNTAVPDANNIGTLPATATAAAPSFTEGNQVGLSTDLAGAARVSVASLPLPSGAATEATLAKLTIAQGADSTSQVGPMVQGIVNDSTSNFTTGMIQPIQLTPDGRLRVATASESYNFTPWGNPTDWGSNGLDVDKHPLTAW